MATEVTFYSEGKEIDARLHLPADIGDEPVPAVVLCHGFTGLKEQILPDHASALADAGYACLRFDYRGFGGSEGRSRLVLPRLQAEDARNAITYLETRDEVANDRIGLYGRAATGGAVATYVAAVDDRLQAMVASMALSDGAEWLRDVRREYEWLDLLDELEENARHRVQTGDSKWISDIAEDGVLIPPPERAEKKFAEKADEQTDKDTKKETEMIPLRSVEGLAEFRPIDVVERIAPCAAKWICIERDSVTPAYHSQELYDRAKEPKELVELPGTHYDIADVLKDDEIAHMIDWFDEHL